MLHLRTMGWRDRDYAKWTDEERRRFYGPGDSGYRVARSSYATGPNQSRLFGSRVGMAPGALLAVIVSLLVTLALGQLPRSHPLIPALHFTLPGLSSAASPGVIRPTGTINTPSSAAVGSTLTFHGTAPPGNGPVTIEGSYDGGQTWQTLSSVGSANGSYAAQITLNQRGILQIRILFADGSHASGSINVG
jgi:hypothetical protein